MEIIENKVANSGLITIDIEHLVPKQTIMTFDIKSVLFMELMLKEKEFREFLKTNDWTLYQGAYVHIICSSDAIVPTWAYMLLQTKLQNIARFVYFGTKQDMMHQLYLQAINNLNLDDYTDQRVVIKGCGDEPIPTNVYVYLTQKLLPKVKSIMYGEPCSTVPVYKKV